MCACGVSFYAGRCCSLQQLEILDSIVFCENDTKALFIRIFKEEKMEKSIKRDTIYLLLPRQFRQRNTERSPAVKDGRFYSVRVNCGALILGQPPIKEGRMGLAWLPCFFLIVVLKPARISFVDCFASALLFYMCTETRFRTREPTASKTSFYHLSLIYIDIGGYIRGPYPTGEQDNLPKRAAFSQGS